MLESWLVNLWLKVTELDATRPQFTITTAVTGWSGDNADNTVEENSSIFSSECTSCRRQGHAGSKTLTKSSSS